MAVVERWMCFKMNETIYSSSDDGALKSLGPFRIFNTDKSLNISQVPELDEISYYDTSGELIFFGELEK